MSGYLTKEEMERRINHQDNHSEPLNEIEYERYGKGKTPGATKVGPIMEAAIVATRPLVSLREAGKAFDVSNGTVHNLSKKAENKSIIENTRSQILDAALGVLKGSIGHITEDKLAKAKITELSGIAKDMAGVLERVEGRDKSDGGRTVVFYPVNRGVDSYEIIEAHAEVIND